MTAPALARCHPRAFIVACLLISPSWAAHADDDPPVDVMLGAGPIGFLDDTAREVLSAGAGLELRMAIATRWRLAFELSYGASLHGVTEPSMPAASLRGLSFELGVRWSPISTVVEPYLGLGLRESYYRVVDGGASSRISVLDYVTHVPISAGVTRRFRSAFVDLRGTYRFAFSDSLLDAGHGSLDTWSVVVGVGYRL